MPQSDSWIILSKLCPADAVPYGNVADISDWDEWHIGGNYLPARLFIHPQQDQSTLNSWCDFIWSDDAFPWVTVPGANLLLESKLLGFAFEPILVVEVNNSSFQHHLKDTLPVLQRMMFMEQTIETKTFPDFYLCPVSGNLIISEQAKTWLIDNCWSNYDTEPLC